MIVNVETVLHALEFYGSLALYLLVWIGWCGGARERQEDFSA